jgi:hypothetical protein
MFALTSFSLFLAVTIYAGVSNKADDRPSGSFGGGFGLTVLGMIQCRFNVITQ